MTGSPTTILIPDISGFTEFMTHTELSHGSSISEISYRDAYMVLMNIPNRPEWLPNLQKVEQQIPAVFLGSFHHCTFDIYRAILSPVQMTLTAERITYAESCLIEEEGLSLIHEFVFSKMDESSCLFSWRFLNADQGHLTEKQRTVAAERMQEMAKNLKLHCDHLEASFFS